ncbi:hypothetical protein J1605_019553 [Eschrichtius robustus]|uniref:Integrator complex subunit 1 RPB2-binding domain-containing protein n=1 Tax=Eschrichtius robustus TaxID=9764 RepID=A0AB34HNN6_ESCRO|nr:hypothetical protein J1605_019553 [Eschrichtius robustus]
MRWPEPRRRTGLEQCFGSRVRPSVQGPPLAAGAGQEWKRLRGRVLTQATVLCADGCASVLFYHCVTARKGGFEVPPAVLLDEIEAAELEGNDDRLEGVLCGAVKQLKVTRAKPDSTLYLSLMYLAKIKPNIFATEGVIEALCSLLRRDASINFKAKGNSLVSVLACNLLMAAYEEDENWPEIFVKGCVWRPRSCPLGPWGGTRLAPPAAPLDVAEALCSQVYIEDSLGERIWVDSPHCRTFVDNVQTAFNTKMPPKSALLQGEAGRSGGELSAGSSPHPSLTEEEDSQTELLIAEEKLSPEQEGQLMPRYEELAESVEEYVLDVLRDQLNRRQPIDSVSRNLLRLLTSACGYKEVRLMAVQKLEMWLQNPKLTRPAQDLLMSVCMNCGTHGPEDMDVISHLIKIRLKPKVLLNHYMLCIRELLNAHKDNLGTTIKFVIFNELSNARNPNNMQTLYAVLQHSPALAPKFLAMVFQDLLTNKDDYLRASRALLREIIKQTKHEINFQAFCLGLMQERKEPQYLDMEFKVGSPPPLPPMPLMPPMPQARAGCLLLGSRPAVSPVPFGVHRAVMGALRARWPIPEAAEAPSCKVQGGAGRVPPGEPVTSGLGVEERFVVHITDVLAVSMMLGITAQVKEAGVAWDKGEKKNLEALRSFQNQMAAIQRDAVWWLHTVVPSVSKLAPRDYAHWYGPRSPARGAAAAWPAWRPVTALTTEVTGRRLAPASQEPAGPALVWRQGLGQSLLLQGSLHKVLFTEQPETYYKWDNWPPESDRK